jgi:hypothetical protein
VRRPEHDGRRRGRANGVVDGGPKYSEPLRITPEVVEELRRLSPALGAALMAASTVIVAINARMLLWIGQTDRGRDFRAGQCCAVGACIDSLCSCFRIEALRPQATVKSSPYICDRGLRFNPPRGGGSAVMSEAFNGTTLKTLFGICVPATVFGLGTLAALATRVVPTDFAASLPGRKCASQTGCLRTTLVARR